MLVFRDTSSIRGAVALLPDLAGPLAQRLSELEEYADYDLSDLLNIVVVQPEDLLADLAKAIGFDLCANAPEAIELHPGWYELTYLLGDDGFGVVVYVPDSPLIASSLRQLCSAGVTRAREP